MRKRKLYQLLALFKEKDYKDFQSFLESSFLNNSSQLIQFWALWQDFMREGPVEEPSVEDFLVGTDIMPRRMDRLCSELKLKAESYLTLLGMERKENAKQAALLGELSARNAPDAVLQRYINQASADIAKQPASSDLYLDSLQLRWLEAEVTIRSRKTQRLWNKGFQELNALVDSYHLLQKLKLRSAAVNARYIFNQGSPEDEQGLPEHFLKRLRQRNAPPLEIAYFLSTEMYDEHSGMERFMELEGLLGEEATGFARAESLELYSYALNFCIHKANQGQVDFLFHAAVLYRQMLDNGLSLEEGKISSQHFKNMVSLHCRIGMLDWVRDFIRDFGPKLDVGPDSPALQYNEAVLAFHLGDYRKAIDLLKENIALTKDDVFYGMDSRVHLWKSYFEFRNELSIEEVDEMFRLYDSFRIFIDRNKKISEPHKRAYRNFIREFKRFVELLDQIPVDESGLHELRKSVSDLDFLANKVWFLQKIDQELEHVSA